MNIPDELKKLRKIQNDLYELIPYCDSSQLYRVEQMIPFVNRKINHLLKQQNDFIDELLIQLNLENETDNNSNN